MEYPRKEEPISEEQVTSVERLPQGVVIHVLAGELRKSEVEQICAAIDEARGTMPTAPFVIDMTNVRFVPSLGMGVIVGLAREFQNRGQRLIFAGMRPDVKQSFTISHLHRLLVIVDDLEEARRTIGG